MRLNLAGAAAVVLLLAPANTDAAIITSLFTQTSSLGTHNDFSGVRAVVADAFGEDHRGILEFDLTGLAPFSTATLNFTLFAEGGSAFNIDLVAYDGDGVYSQSGDFAIAPFATITSFSNAAAAAGSALSFDVTSALNTAVTNGYGFFGVRLQRTDDPAGTANFADFRTFEIETSAASAPEPATLLLLGVGMAAAGARRWRQQRG